jgi:hypothetical protein
MNSVAQSMDGGGGGGDGRRRALPRWALEGITAMGDGDGGGTIAVSNGNSGGDAMEGKTAVRSRCAT